MLYILIAAVYLVIGTITTAFARGYLDDSGLDAMDPFLVVGWPLVLAVVLVHFAFSKHFKRVYQTMVRLGQKAAERNRTK